MRIGILALQGAVGPHAEKLSQLGVNSIEVRHPDDLEGISGMILPGGESTTMLHLIRLNGLWEPLKRYVHTRPVWGVCAGMILLAHHVSSPEQESLDAIDIDVERNAYGRQICSFIDELTADEAWDSGKRVEGVFIRAPKVSRVGPAATTLIRWKNEPVLIEEGLKLASSFHPELTDSLTIHQYFLKKCEA